LNIQNTFLILNFLNLFFKFLISFFSFLFFKLKDVNLADNNGMTALHHAVSEQNESLVRLLLQHGSDVNYCTNESVGSPMTLAIQTANERIIEILAESGADVNCSTKNGNTALHLAAHAGNEKLLRLLLKCGAEVDRRNNDNTTPLLRARQQGHEHIIQILIEHFCQKHGIVDPNKNNNNNNHNNIDGSEEKGAELQRINTPDSDLKDEKCCKVCWEREADSVLLWCGHVALCLYCTQFLQLCPICCQPIKKVQRVYLS
jgi:ankyrin repeat protein